MPSRNDLPKSLPWVAIGVEDQERLAAELGPETGATALATWFRLCAEAFKQGTCTPNVSYRRLARETGLGLRTVQRRVADLERLGFVAVLHAVSRDTGNMPTRFTILRGIYSETPCSHNGHTLWPMMQCISGYTFQEVFQEDDKKSGMSTYPADRAELASQLYRTYPKHVGKAAALKAIAKALQSAPFETLLEGVTAYAAAVKAWPQAEFRYVPHPATWFNARRWEDDRATWQRTERRPNGATVLRVPSERYATKPENM